MDVYKVVFEENEPVSQKKLCESASDYSSYYYEQKKGKLTYAIIKAKSGIQLRTAIRKILREIGGKWQARFAY